MNETSLHDRTACRRGLTVESRSLMLFSVRIGRVHAAVAGAIAIGHKR